MFLESFSPTTKLAGELHWAAELRKPARLWRLTTSYLLGLSGIAIPLSLNAVEALGLFRFYFPFVASGQQRQ